MGKKRWVFALGLALLLGVSAAAQAELTWSGEFPAAPENMTGAYTAQKNPQLTALAEHALGVLGIAQEDVSRKEDSIFAAIGEEESGERTTLRCDGDGLHYARDTRAAQTPVDVEEALAQVKAFAEALLGTDAYTSASVRVEPYYDESGVLNENMVDFVWDKQTEQGVAVHDLRLSATYAQGRVTALHLWDAQLAAAESTADYACTTAQDALAHLNYAIAHIAPAHTCTSFDDPNDALTEVYPVYTQVFSQDGLYTPAWAFVRRDAENNWRKSPVLVDWITGDVWDSHDGRLPGAGE